MHVSAGLGQTTPLRFGCPPEATWIECLPAQPASPPSQVANPTIGVLPPDQPVLSSSAG